MYDWFKLPTQSNLKIKFIITYGKNYKQLFFIKQNNVFNVNDLK